MKLYINSYAYGNASGNPQSADGPAIIADSDFLEPKDQFVWLNQFSIDNDFQKKSALNSVADLNQQLAKATADLCQQQKRFVTIGGDHSCAIGTWSGASVALAEQSSLGLVWIDAHLDSNTFATTPSNNIHGMPLAVLLGHGDQKLTGILSDHHKIKASNVVIIGARSFESLEHQLLKKLGVKIFYMNDIEQFGLAEVFQRALQIVTTNTVGFGISFDIDAIDPDDAPGTATKEKNGINADQFLNNSPILTNHPALIGAEIAEFNPYLDVDNKTEKLIVDYLELLV